jgi:hypothetical protein
MIHVCLSNTTCLFRYNCTTGYFLSTDCIVRITFEVLFTVHYDIVRLLLRQINLISSDKERKFNWFNLSIFLAPPLDIHDRGRG